MKWKSVVWVCLLGLPILSGAQVTVSVAPEAASKEDVKKLFDVMAGREQMRQMMDQLMAQMRAMNREQIKKRHPDISEEELARWDHQSEDLIKNFPLDEMLEEMVSVYQRHFNKSDIDALTAFYSSPTGQKFLHEMPTVTGETMRAVYPRLQAQIDAATKKVDEKDDSKQK
jgi:uncharacterized protein